MSWAFIQHATEYMSRPRLGDKKPPTLWPSEATAIITNQYGEQEVVGKCRRATFFRYLLDSYEFDRKFINYKPLVEELKGKSIPTDPYLQWIWRAGELYEEHLIGLAKASGVYIADQVPIYAPQWNLSGKIDLVVVNPDTGLFSAVEVKSVYGFNANFVLGTPTDRKKGQLGTPKDSNLMQIALYDWWYASEHSGFEESRLVYGARDTGRFAEYAIKTPYDEEKSQYNITYEGLAPTDTSPTTSPITIDSILAQYKFVSDSLDNGKIPARDFDQQYSDEKIALLHSRGELSKADSERVAKRLEQIQQGKDKLNKQIEKGDFQCNFCQFAKVCYNENGTSRNL